MKKLFNWRTIVISVIAIVVAIVCLAGTPNKLLSKMDYLAKLTQVENDSKLNPEIYGKSADKVVEKLNSDIKYKNTSGIENMSKVEGVNLTSALNTLLTKSSGVQSVNDVTGAITLSSKSGNVIFVIDKDKRIIDFDIKGVVPDNIVKTLNTLTGDINISSTDGSVDITLKNNNINLAAKSGIQKIGKATAKEITLYADTSVNFSKFEWDSTEDGKVMLRVPIVDPTNNPMAEQGFVTKEKASDWNTRVTQQEKGRLEADISENRLDIKNKIGDAPIDTETYARKAGKWENISSIFNSITDYIPKITGITFGTTPDKNLKTIIAELKHKQDEIPFNNIETFYVNGKGVMSVPQGDDKLLRAEVGKLKTGNAEDWKAEVLNVKYLGDTIKKKLPLCTKDNSVLMADKEDKNHRWVQPPTGIKSINGSTNLEQHFTILDGSPDQHPEEPVIVTNKETGWSYVYMPKLQFDTTKYGVVGDFTIKNITGEDKVVTNPAITLKQAKAEIDNNKKILQTNIENSDSITVENLDNNKVKLHANVKGGRGLTDIYHKELHDIKGSTTKPQKVKLYVGEDIDHLLDVTSISLKEVKSETKNLVTFTDNDRNDWYYNDRLVTDNKLHFKNNQKYYFNHDVSEDYAVTKPFHYSKTAKSALSPVNALSLQLMSNDFNDGRIQTDSFIVPYRDMLKEHKVGDSKGFITRSYSTGAFKKRSWFHLILDPTIYTGDFEYAFSNIRYTGASGDNEITKAWDKGKPYDDKWALYGEFGIYEPANGLYNRSIFDKNKTVMVGAINSGEKHEVYFLPGVDPETTKYTLNCLNTTSTPYVSVLYKRTGDILTITGIVMKGTYLWNGDINDPNIQRKYKFVETKYTAPIQLFTAITSYNYDPKDTKSNTVWIYDNPPRMEKPCLFGAGYLIIKDDKVYSWEGGPIGDGKSAPYYLAARADSWKALSKTQKKELVDKFARNRNILVNYHDIQKVYETGEYQIATPLYDTDMHMLATCPYVGKTAVFMKKDIDLKTTYDAIGVDRVKIVYNIMSKGDKPVEPTAANQYLKMLVSTDKGVTWYTCDFNHKWIKVHIENPETPTENDIKAIYTKGMMAGEIEILPWKKLPHEGRTVDQIRFALYLENKDIGHMLYVDSITANVVKSNHWDQIIESYTTYDYTIDYEHMTLDFEFFNEFKFFNIYASIFNPEIVHEIHTTKQSNYEIAQKESDTKEVSCVASNTGYAQLDVIAWACCILSVVSLLCAVVAIMVVMRKRKK